MHARYALILLPFLFGPSVVAQSGCPSSVTDIDGNIYPVVQIGNQCWTAKNLAVTHYANGDSIPFGLTDADWEFTTAGASSVFAFDPANESTYGRLYNWFAATDARNICASGWHVPSDEEWKTMELALGMDPGEVDNINYRGTAANVGGQLKSVTGWVVPNTGATNSTGFSALPGGYAGYDQTFEFLTTWGNYWTASDNGSGSGYGRTLASYEAGISRGQHIPQVGYSCRCVYDQLVGVEEEGTRPTLGLFPNPATNAVQVSFTGAGDIYTLHNAMGQVVLRGRLVTGLNTIDIAALPVGAYLLRTEESAAGVRLVKQ